MSDKKDILITVTFYQFVTETNLIRNCIEELSKLKFRTR